jgi:outer membrane protein with glycine zipper
MSRASTCWTDGRVALRVAILTLGVALAIAPDAFAWGRRAFGGGFGGGGFGGESFGGGEGFNQGGGEGGGGGFPSGGTSQSYIYPSRGQSPQQEQSDRGQCYTWAVQQSGFDPANPRVSSGPPPTVGTPQGGMFRGAAGGAAIGAIGGAIGGNAGKGAAIGAAAGGLFGGMRRRSWQEQEESQENAYQERQENMLSQGRGNFNQAFGVCMTGRGYTVG